MSKKSMRLDFIRNILLTKEIHSQEELLDEMQKAGFDYAQATLSRDLRQLRAAKTTDTMGCYKYVLPDNPKYVHRVRRTNYTSLSGASSFLHLDIGGELLLLHTMPGFAMPLAVGIDSYHFDDIAGTISGDDTILVIVNLTDRTAQVPAGVAQLLEDGVGESQVLLSTYDAVHSVKSVARGELARWEGVVIQL